MKKLITLFLLTASFAAFGQVSSMNRVVFTPLLSGYNVLLTSNTTGNAAANAVGPGSTNIMFTTGYGNVLFSLVTNLVNGVLNTNLTAPDAFATGETFPDVNGDYQSNCELMVYINNTNWVPPITTNSIGQWIVPPPGFTNAMFPTTQAGWILQSGPGSGFPSWSAPVSTNAWNYPIVIDGAASTNVLVVELFGAPSGTANGADNGPAVPIWDTTARFTYNITWTGAGPVKATVVLPPGALAGCKKVKAEFYTIVTNSLEQVIINQCGLTQPHP
jgi:hypothetical protein